MTIFNVNTKNLRLRLASVISILMIIGTFGLLTYDAYMKGGVSEVIAQSLINILSMIVGSIFGYTLNNNKKEVHGTDGTIQ